VLGPPALLLTPLAIGGAVEVTGDPFSLTVGEFSQALRADSILKVRLKVVGGAEVRLELCCIVSLLGRGRVLGKGTLLTKVSSIFALLVATVLGREEEGVV